jgi:hypothetical protein
MRPTRHRARNVLDQVADDADVLQKFRRELMPLL